jgi:hypothetical protein
VSPGGIHSGFRILAPYGAVTNPALPGLEISFVSKMANHHRTGFLRSLNFCTFMEKELIISPTRQQLYFKKAGCTSVKTGLYPKIEIHGVVPQSDNLTGKNNKASNSTEKKLSYLNTGTTHV